MMVSIRFCKFCVLSGSDTIGSLVVKRCEYTIMIHLSDL